MSSLMKKVLNVQKASIILWMGAPAVKIRSKIAINASYLRAQAMDLIFIKLQSTTLQMTAQWSNIGVAQFAIWGMI
jgi:hypothetical protein